MPTDVGLTWESRDSKVLYLIRERTMAGWSSSSVSAIEGKAAQNYERPQTCSVGVASSNTSISSYIFLQYGTNSWSST